MENVGSNNNEDFFNSVIDTEFGRTKVRTLIALNTGQFYNMDVFKYKLKQNLHSGQHYSVLVKIKDTEGSFKMLDSQMGFSFQDDGSIENLFQLTDTKFVIFLQQYNYYISKIEYLQFNFILLDKKLLSQFYSDSSTKDSDVDKKPNVVASENDENLGDELIVNNSNNSNNSSNKKVSNSYVDSYINKLLNIPVSVNEEYIGNKLKVSYDKNKNVNNIELVLDGKTINFLSLILEKVKYLPSKHRNAIKTFDDKYSFYLLKDNRPYVLAIQKIDDNTIKKIRYQLDGSLINQVLDIVNEGRLFRGTGNKQLYMESVDGKFKVVESYQLNEFKPLEVEKTKGSFIPNPNLGVIDCEAYLDNGMYKIYALGFKSNLDKNPVTYYIDPDKLDSDKLVIDFIDELLRSKYNNTIFYCHNLGGYDIVFILHSLSVYNTKHEDKYEYKCILRKDNIIKISISKKINNTIRKVTFVDSYTILNDSLHSLCNKFGTEYVKGKFPYTFSTKENLFYVGDKPAMHFYKNITQDEYNNIKDSDWSFKEESLKYLHGDLNSLFEIINKFNKQVFNDFNINITDSTTISGLALNIFLKRYYKNNIPSIQKRSIYNDIKQGYYGGITEVYKPYGENLYYYDVNSLYPYVSLQDMPGLSCKNFIYYKDVYFDVDSKLFGFFYCEIETPKDDYLGFLPYRSSHGSMYPLGHFKGWYFSEELRYGCELGYKVKIIKGYEFNRVKDVFKSYIKDIYKIKSTTKNPTQKSMSKSLLNNLLGRFGISLSKPTTKLVSEKRFAVISLMYKITSYKEIGNKQILVTYIPSMDSDVIRQHDLDITKLLSKYKDNEIQTLNNASVAISASITAYARIHITKIKNQILSQGGNIYYSDTDSIVTDIELDKNLVSENILGKLKLEHKIKKGIFISGKLYTFVTDQGELVKKIKGGNSDSIEYSDYENLLLEKKITASKVESKKHWTEGYVVIQDKSIILKPNINSNRVKIYDNNNKWIDTKPYIVDYRDNENTKNNISGSLHVSLKKIFPSVINIINNISAKFKLLSKSFIYNFTIYISCLFFITVLIVNSIVSVNGEPILDDVYEEYLSSFIYDQLRHKTIQIRNERLDKSDKMFMEYPSIKTEGSEKYNGYVETSEDITEVNLICDKLVKNLMENNIMVNRKYLCVEELTEDFYNNIDDLNLKSDTKKLVLDKVKHLLEDKNLVNFLCIEESKHSDAVELLELESKFLDRWNKHGYDVDLINSMEERLQSIEEQLKTDINITNMESINALVKDKDHIIRELQHAHYVNDVIMKEKQVLYSDWKNVSNILKTSKTLYDIDLSFKKEGNHYSPTYSTKSEVLEKLALLDKKIYSDEAVKELNQWLLDTDKDLNNVTDNSRRDSLENKRAYILDQLDKAKNSLGDRSSYVDNKMTEIAKIKARIDKADWMENTDSFNINKLFSEEEGDN